SASGTRRDNLGFTTDSGLRGGDHDDDLVGHLVAFLNARLRDALTDQRSDVAKKFPNARNKLLLLQTRAPHLVNSPCEVVEQLRLVQEFCSSRGVVLADD